MGEAVEFGRFNNGDLVSSLPAPEYYRCALLFSGVVIFVDSKIKQAEFQFLPQHDHAA